MPRRLLLSVLHRRVCKRTDISMVGPALRSSVSAASKAISVSESVGRGRLVMNGHAQARRANWSSESQNAKRFEKPAWHHFRSRPYGRWWVAP